MATSLFEKQLESQEGVGVARRKKDGELIIVPLSKTERQQFETPENQGPKRTPEGKILYSGNSGNY